MPAKAGTVIRNAAAHHAAARTNILTSLNGGMKRTHALSRLFVQERHNMAASAARLSPHVLAVKDRKQRVATATPLRTILPIKFELAFTRRSLLRLNGS